MKAMKALTLLLCAWVLSRPRRGAAAPQAMRRSAPTEGLGRPITGRAIAIAIGLYLALNLAWAVISPLIRP